MVAVPLVWQEVTGDVDEPSRPWATDVLSLQALVPFGDVRYVRAFPGLAALPAPRVCGVG